MTVVARRLLRVAAPLIVLSCGGAEETDVLSPLTKGAPELGANPETAPNAGNTGDEDEARDEDKKKKKKKPRDDEEQKEPEPEPAPAPADQPTCAAEKEDNNSQSKANPLEPCVRGTLSGSGDKDFFRLPVTQDGRLLIAHSSTGGTIQYTVTEENGAPVTGLNVKFTDRAPDIDVAAGKAYIFQVSFPDLSAPGGGARNYELRVSLR